ncbi:hypothetical protein ACRRTK_019267 [Alexandromys fortis]
MASTALEIVAFTVSISGWVLVSSTLPTDYWKVSTIDGTVITTATYFANLWKMCVTDSTGVANCKDFPSMLALEGLHPFGSPFLRVFLGTRQGNPPGRRSGPTLSPGRVYDAGCPVGRLLKLGTLDGEACYIQACRGLMIAAVSLGFFGSIFALFGMKCTKVGGSEKAKAKLACLAGIVFILSGLCSMTGCSLYANKITTEFFDPLFMEQKYELGAALFIGWAGASLCIIGGVIFCFSISDNNKTPSREAIPNKQPQSQGVMEDFTGTVDG